MSRWNVLHRTGRILPIALAAALSTAAARPVRAELVTVPPVPAAVAVKDGFTAFLVGHAIGSQNYVCLPNATGVGFSLFTPEATLLNDDGKQLITHFFGPNPDEPNLNPNLFAVGPIRAAWQYKDGSTVWGLVAPGNASVDPNFVAPNSIAWLLVTVAGQEDGFEGGNFLSSQTKFIQRLNTHGGVAPATGCSTTADIGHLAFVPYTADYFFYRAND